MKRELKLVIWERLMARTPYCRAYPDEKGIETSLDTISAESFSPIAEPIPMKRELKPKVYDHVTIFTVLLQSLSR